MNDKLALWTPEYKKNSNFNSNFDYRKTVETFAATSEIIEKERYFYNGEKFNVDLDGRGLLIKVNPNKFLDIQLGDFIPFQQFQLVLDGLQNGVVDVGIDVNLKDCKIVRYDNSFDLRISNSYNSYLPIISLLLPKTRKRKQQKNIIENTLYYGNRSNCLSVYDKAAEQKLPNNWLRMELRHLKVRNLELSSINEKRYLEYRKSDKQKIMNLVFSNEPIALKDHLLSRFLYLIENESRANQLSLIHI